MSNNEDSSFKDEPTTSRDTRNSSFTECLSMGPIAAASRLMSSLSRQPRSSIPAESNDNTEKSPKSSSFLHPIPKRGLQTRNRSVSPNTPSSDPSNSATNPFLTNSSSTMRNSCTTPSGLNHISKSSTDPTPETVGFDFNFNSTYTQLRELAEINCDYFSQQKTDVCRRFERLLIILTHSLEISVPLIRRLTESFHYFDYSPEVKNRIFLFLYLSFNK
jgi:hypothetical protein